MKKSHALTVVSHPLIQHKLTLMRKEETPCSEFRMLLKEISLLLAYEVTRDLELTSIDIKTPIQPMRAPVVKNTEITLVSILRAGNGLLEGMLELLPFARVGHIGLYRDPATLAPVEYYFKMPPQISKQDIIVVDPMLATGNSSIAAIARIKEKTPRSIKFMSLLAAPEGIELMQQEHPDVHIYTAAIDTCLNEHGYITPGLGDAGDRIFGTR